MGNGDVTARLLAEQAAYYRARAPEYDEWWQRIGRYDHGPEALARWQAELATVQAAWSASVRMGRCWSSPAAPAGGPSG